MEDLTTTQLSGDSRTGYAVLADSIGDLVDTVASVDRSMAAMAAVRARLIDRAREWSEFRAAVAEPRSSSRVGWDPATVARRELVTELACALRLPERTTENLIAESRALLHDLPATYSALSDGEIGYRHARIVIDHADSLPEEARSSFERAALPFARTLTAAKFDRKARLLRERAHPETIEQRHAASLEDREVTVQSARDGMAWLNAYLPAVEAHAIVARLTEVALGLRGQGEPRTLTQLRTDVLSDLLINGVVDEPEEVVGDAPPVDPGHPTDRTHPVGRSHPAAHARGIRARVLITVPVLRLLGQSDEPATLEGHGPIDIDTARRLTAGAPSLTRILTHPETGAVLSVGRDRYRVPQDLRDWLRLRDETCRAVGCSRPASGCDIDHTVDWQYGGGTAYDNLAFLCEKHHNQKHHTGWAVTQVGGGVLEWVSPSGRSYRTEPAGRIRPSP